MTQKAHSPSRNQKLFESLRTKTISEGVLNVSGPADLLECIAAVKGNLSLTTLRVFPSPWAVGPEGAQALATALGGSCVSFLDLEGHQIRKEGVGALVDVLKHLPLTHLSLARNSIGDEGIQVLAAGMEGSQLETLLLGGSNIGHEGARALAKGLSRLTVRKLCLEYNDIGDEGAKALARGLQQSMVTRLSLGSNHIGAEGASALAAVLKDSFVDFLDLSRNLIGEDGGLALLEGVRDSGVSQLRVESCGCSEGTLSEITAALKENTERSFVLQLQVEGDEIFTFRRIDGEVAAMLDGPDGDLPKAVLAKMREQRPWKQLRAQNLRIVRSDLDATAPVAQLLGEWDALLK